MSAQTLSALGEPLVSAAATMSEIACSAMGAFERSSVGPTRPLESLGDGMLRFMRETLMFTPHTAGSFAPLTIPIRNIRTATTERADTLQIATTASAW